LGVRGFQINGVERFDNSGRSLSAAGDVNGDGLGDLIIGSNGADPGYPRRINAGESYVLFSTATPSTTATYRTQTLPGNAPRQPIGIVGDGSNDSTPDSRAFIDFADGSTTSTQTVTLTRNNFAIQDIPKPASVMWELTTNRTDWTSAEVTFRYTDAEIAGLQEFLLTLYTAETPLGPWLPVQDSTLDGFRQEIKGTVTNLGYFAIAEFFAPPVNDVIELSEVGTNHPGFVINGFNPYDRSGVSVSGAGDVNGDGLADVIVGANNANPNGLGYAGEAYVVFGKLDQTPVELSNLGTGGFRIPGIDVYDRTGYSVSGAGDLNGDGLADLIVGALFAGELIPSPYGGFYSTQEGRSYVVFGKADSSDVDLENLGSGGFQINGIDKDDNSGFSVSGAGDVNGDGLTDLIVGALEADGGGYSNSGESYVVFGKTDTTTVELSTLGSGGFLIEGANENDLSGHRVSGAGDFNGDGLDDLLVGAYEADPNGLSNAGSAYLLFGKTDTFTILLSNLGTRGFRIDGLAEGDRLAHDVSGAGDVNGDGLADLIVGAYNSDLNGKSNSGVTYVLFGTTDSTPFDLANLGTKGFRIDGVNRDDYSGYSASGAGDMNGDGLADLIIGAFASDPDGKFAAGESYVVFGKADNSTIALSNLGSSGFRIEGIASYDNSGSRVSAAGDVNGDGLADVIIGASWADPDNIFEAGQSYVVFSTATPPTLSTYLAKALPGDAPRQAIGITGDGSNDSTPDSRAFIDFADGSTTSTQTVTLARNNFFVEGIPKPANTYWMLRTERTNWTSADVSFRYTDADIAGLDESSLTLYTANFESGPWSALPNQSLDTSRQIISGKATEFGFFAIGEFFDPPVNKIIELSELGTTYPGFVINGIAAYDYSGWQVSGAGDVNGDGLSDLIVGAFRRDIGTRYNVGESYVVFGKLDSTPVELSNLGSGGFRIEGKNPYDYSSLSVSSAGDVNGDGFADLVIGASRASILAGESYVVFGKPDPNAVFLSDLGIGGFQITGIAKNDHSGISVSGAGDVNGDGLDDLVIGASNAFNGGYDPSGSQLFGEGQSYVVFGKTDSSTIVLSNLGQKGFVIQGMDPADCSGCSVSGAGDVNGDGLADLVIGARRAGDYIPNLYGYYSNRTGESYVVFGKDDDTTVSLSNLESKGFLISGINKYDFAGGSVSGAGDVNGDGLADIVIGADGAGSVFNYNGREYQSRNGHSYVVFGKPDDEPIELETLGNSGFQIEGINRYDYSGTSVHGAGDLNGDGLADLIVGAPRATFDNSYFPRIGESYVIFGKQDSTPVALSSLGANGFRIQGIDPLNFMGRSVAGAGDVNGDGLADVIMGAYGANPNQKTNAGQSYVLFSTAMPPTTATYLAKALPGDAPRQAIGITGDGSNDSTPDSRAFIDFADGITLSTQTVTLTRTNTNISNLSQTANVLWELSTDREAWSNAEVTFRYTDAEIAELMESELILYQAPTPAGPWSPVPGFTLQPERNQIRGNVSALGYFTLSNEIDVSDAWMVR
ncbi:MAG: hypothetical protein SFY68_07765, partial [Candidatus Sumerlaeia bacterium]|nr:hypothetical protein [Candidatus Sumerlaeia bacterium]